MAAIPGQEDIHSVYRRRSYMVGIGNFILRHGIVREQRLCKSIYVRRRAIKFMYPIKGSKTQLRLFAVATRRLGKDMFGNMYLTLRRSLRPPFASPSLLDGMIGVGRWP